MTRRICAEVARLELRTTLGYKDMKVASLEQFGLHSAKSYVKSFRRVKNHDPNANFIACLNVARPSSFFTYKPVTSLRW
jgi:hypothetical protein